MFSTHQKVKKTIFLHKPQRYYLYLSMRERERECVCVCVCNVKATRSITCLINYGNNENFTFMPIL